jgi:uncharacterized protein (DUF924 family)
VSGGGRVGPEEVLAFWFGDALVDAEAAAERGRTWFTGDAAFDEEIRLRFGHLPEQVAEGVEGWDASPASQLARVLVLDQFPRNCFRGTPRAFAFDPAARRLAAAALTGGADAALHPLEAVFLLLPLEHAEDPVLQDRSVASFERLESRAPSGLEERFAAFTDSARRHREVIRRFGRFPHRNAVLGRKSTPEEADYLASGGEVFGTRPSEREA